MNTIENPFCAVADTACDRDVETGEGGKLAWDRFFRGEDMGFFGGVEWRTPIEKLTLKAEVSSDAYTREERDPEAGFERKSPFNFGAEYRIRPGVTLGGYYMYGDTLGVNIVVSGNPKQAAGAAEPRPGAAAGQPAAGGRQPQHRLGGRPAGAADGDRGDRQGARRRGS